MKRLKRLKTEGNAFDGLHKIFEHRSRLATCVLLSKNQKLSFRRLKDLLSETDGNLGAQLKKLESANMISVEKEFVERKPITWYSITREGKKALKVHLKALEKLMDGVI
ncbi:MAG: transcriptional regulator [Pseudomonadota bacterium]